MTKPRQRKSIDWQHVRERLQQAAVQLAEADRPTPERVRAILDERARAAAVVPAEAPSAGAIIEVLRFDLGPESFALETNCLRGILHFKDFAPLPNTPDFLVGITNVRGQIVAIFDLRRFFGVAAREAKASARVILVGTERIEFGLLADAVHEVVMLRIDQIRETPASAPAGAREFLRGVTADALLVLDGMLLLNDPQLYIDLGDDGAVAREVKP